MSREAVPPPMLPMELGLPHARSGLAAVATGRDLGVLLGLGLLASMFTVHMINVARAHPEILEPSAGQVGCCVCFAFMWLLWAVLRLLPAVGARSKVTGPGSHAAAGSAKSSSFPMLAALQATSLEYVDAAAELCVFPLPLLSRRRPFGVLVLHFSVLSPVIP